MRKRKLREYEPIWLSLKKHKTVSVRTNQSLHKRLIKAVIKEKWMDDQFKQREGWRMMWLTYSTAGDVVTFNLNYKLTEILPKDL